MVFRIAALASPLLLGFLLPFVLALGRDRAWALRRRAGAAAIAVGGWTGLLGVLWTFSGEPVGRLLETACFLLAFGAFLWGLFHLLAGLRLPPAAAQAGCGVVVALLMGTIFCADPILETHPQPAVRDRVLHGNPYAVMAFSIFEEDVFHRRVLYGRTALSDLERSYPDWSRVALWYVLLGFWFQVGFLALTALRWRLRGS